MEPRISGNADSILPPNRKQNSSPFWLISGARSLFSLTVCVCVCIELVSIQECTKTFCARMDAASLSPFQQCYKSHPESHGQRGHLCDFMTKGHKLDCKTETLTKEIVGEELCNL